MIKLIIFDLDNTLFDTYSQIGKRVLDDLIREMKKAGLTSEQEKILRERYAYTGFRIIAKQLGFNQEITNLGMSVYKTMDLSHLTPFADVKVIPGLQQSKILVTSGVHDVQQKKVDLLGLRNYFEQVIIDESSSLENKRIIFEKIMKEKKLKPSEVMIIGDNPESEIAAGNKLDMVTVQIVRRQGMLLGPSTHKIKTLNELAKLLR